MQGRATHAAIIAGLAAVAIALVAIMASWVIDSGVGGALIAGSPAFSDPALEE